MSSLDLRRPRTFKSDNTGVEKYASAMLPINERGTTPGKIKWSYCCNMRRVQIAWVAQTLTFSSPADRTPYIRMSWVAWRLKLSSTLVNGATRTWAAPTRKKSVSISMFRRTPMQAWWRMFTRLRNKHVAALWLLQIQNSKTFIITCLKRRFLVCLCFHWYTLYEKMWKSTLVCRSIHPGLSEWTISVKYQRYRSQLVVSTIWLAIPTRCLTLFCRQLVRFRDHLVPLADLN